MVKRKGGILMAKDNPGDFGPGNAPRKGNKGTDKRRKGKAGATLVKKDNPDDVEIAPQRY